jgi:hypothetical protein
VTHLTGTTPGPAFASKKRLFVMAVTFWRKDESDAKEGRCRNHPISPITCSVGADFGAYLRKQYEEIWPAHSRIEHQGSMSCLVATKPGYPATASSALRRAAALSASATASLARRRAVRLGGAVSSVRPHAKRDLGLGGCKPRPGFIVGEPDQKVDITKQAGDVRC